MPARTGVLAANMRRHRPTTPADWYWKIPYDASSTARTATPSGAVSGTGGTDPGNGTSVSAPGTGNASHYGTTFGTWWTTGPASWPSSLTVFTLSVWMRLSSDPARTWVAEWTSTAMTTALWFGGMAGPSFSDSTERGLYISNGSTAFANNLSLPSGVWHLLHFIKDGSAQTVDVYLDGAASASLHVTSANSSAGVIGFYVGVGGDLYKALLFRRALTASERAAQYANPQGE